MLYVFLFEFKGGSQSCAICGLSFQQIDEFKQHMQKHNQTFGCGFCRQRFKTNFALKKHHEREHESTVATQMGKFILYFIQEF